MNPDSMAVVVSAYRIPRDVIDAFIGWNAFVFKANDVKLFLVLDRMETFTQPWIYPVRYPREQEQFSLPKTVNYGLRRAAEVADVLVKSDIDIIFSSSILEQVRRTVTPMVGLVGICANVQTPEHLATKNWARATKRRTGMGACFAMHRTAWFALCGYNEKMIGWGADDTDMHRRASRALTINVTDECPLYHVNHQERKSKDKGAFFEFRSQQNLMVSVIPWHSVKWGEASE
jgi:hypothetical protein